MSDALRCTFHSGSRLGLRENVWHAQVCARPVLSWSPRCAYRSAIRAPWIVEVSRRAAGRPPTQAATTLRRAPPGPGLCIVTCVDLLTRPATGRTRCEAEYTWGKAATALGRREADRGVGV